MGLTSGQQTIANNLARTMKEKAMEMAPRGRTDTLRKSIKTRKYLVPKQGGGFRIVVTLTAKGVKPKKGGAYNYAYHLMAPESDKRHANEANTFMKDAMNAAVDELVGKNQFSESFISSMREWARKQKVSQRLSTSITLEF